MCCVCVVMLFSELTHAWIIYRQKWMTTFPELWGRQQLRTLILIWVQLYLCVQSVRLMAACRQVRVASASHRCTHSRHHDHMEQELLAFPQKTVSAGANGWDFLWAKSGFEFHSRNKWGKHTLRIRWFAMLESTLPSWNYDRYRKKLEGKQVLASWLGTLQMF